MSVATPECKSRPHQRPGLPAGVPGGHPEDLSGEGGRAHHPLAGAQPGLVRPRLYRATGGVTRQAQLLGIWKIRRH